MTEHERTTGQPTHTDFGAGEHERRAHELDESPGGEFLNDGDPEDDAMPGPTVDEGRRPTSNEDLAADQRGGGGADDDVVGDDQSSPGQNSDRLPQ